MDYQKNWTKINKSYKMLALDPILLMGRSLMLFMKHGGTFYFKAIEAGQEWIGGFDDEGLDLRIYMRDIDFVVEVTRA